jgi:hypothetical protein
MDGDLDIGFLMKWINRLVRSWAKKMMENEIGRRYQDPSPEERLSIESHVSHTYEFLSQIAD